MNYQDVQDPAVTVKFPLVDQPGSFLLAWTTTPWTLPSNLALAVGEELDYVWVADVASGERFLLAEARYESYQHLLKSEWRIEERVKGRALLGLRYHPVFSAFEDERNRRAFRVIHSDHVTTDNGTGLVHMAPAFGEDDFRACQLAGIGIVDPVDMEGRFTDQVPEVAGLNIKDADKVLIRCLKESGFLLHQGTLQHSYPFCWRSNTPLIYKAIEAWFVKVETIKDELIENNAQIKWVPEFVGTKRFGNWLENARDWNISRNRYWGTPLPIWRCDDTGEYVTVGSVAELEELSGQTVHDLHRHFIDELTFERDGHVYRRVPEVFDCWFESGSMPYAQNHYPFENKALVDAHFPANFVAEGLDQTRGWFYTLNILSTALFQKPAFKNVVVNGLILAEDGQKMSKQKKNYPDPMTVIDRFGADCLRSYLINSPVVRAEPMRFSESGIAQIYRTVVSPLWNAYSFFVTYANLDHFQPAADWPGSDHELDKWIVSKFQSLVGDVIDHMTFNHLYAVVPELQQFIDSLTNWYIRRSRRRFWRAENDGDKAQAYQTLYYVLVEFSKVMAPFLPFLCEAMYRNLTAPLAQRSPISVHLCDFPVVREAWKDVATEQAMNLVRQVVEMGRSLRAANNLKIRQPLASLSLVADQATKARIDSLQDVICDELNVKTVTYLEDETALVAYSARPNLKVLGPRFGKALKVLNPAIRALGHEQICHYLAHGSLQLDGHDLIQGDLLVDRNEKPDQVVASEDGLTLALDTQLTPALLLEGDARELVNRIQNLRKEAGFNVEDRILVQLGVSDWLVPLLEQHGDYIAGETLAEQFGTATIQAEIEKSWEVNGKNLTIGIARVLG